VLRRPVPLARARAGHPNKLDWAADDKAAAGNWNRRPRDVKQPHAVDRRASERDLNWQIMNLNAPLADWHDAPILYISGSDPIKLAKEHVDKLRQYVHEGGMILAHADCGKGGFVGSATKLAGELFPSYEFRELPESHPIYAQPYPRAKWKTKPTVMGVSNGVRELMLLIPQGDPAKVWQIGAFRGARARGQLGANIVYYAADQRDLRFKARRTSSRTTRRRRPTRPSASPPALQGQLGPRAGRLAAAAQPAPPDDRLDVHAPPGWTSAAGRSTA
jgi:hypothetical protein